MTIVRFVFSGIAAIACAASAVAAAADVAVSPATTVQGASSSAPAAAPATVSLDRADALPLSAPAQPTALTDPDARAAAEKAAKSVAEKERSDAWRETLDTLFPNSPGDIREYRQRSADEAKAAAPRVAPKEALSQAIPVSLLPGGRSPKLTLLHGFVMAIEVLDASGQPWPIVTARTGDKEAFEVIRTGEGEEGKAVAAQGDHGGTAPVPKGVVMQGTGGPGNIVTITARKRFQPSNLILVLQGESRPISVILVPTEATEVSDLQDRVTLLVDGNGPLAKPQAVASYDRLDVGDDLRRALVGNEPKEGAAEILASLPPGMRAWTDHTTLWLRTPEQVISPAPQAAVSMGNMRAYRLPYLPTVVLLNDGHLTPVAIHGEKANATRHGGL